MNFDPKVKFGVTAKKIITKCVSVYHFSYTHLIASVFVTVLLVSVQTFDWLTSDLRSVASRLKPVWLHFSVEVKQGSRHYNGKI